MNYSKKLTLSDLLLRKEQKEKERSEFKRVYVQELEGELEIRKLPLVKFLDMLDGLDDNSSPGESMRRQMEVIYECCPLFHNQELQEAYEVADPVDIVAKVLNDNMGAMTTIIAEIFSFYGMESDALTQLKNS